MSIQLDPLELGFRRPFTQEVTEVLHLRNTSSDPVAFKVKTTAPKQYCVRPNSGRIDPGEDVEVQVLLQAMKEDPPLEIKCRDKFLVQTVAVPASQNFKNWSDIETTSKSSIQEKKIRVNYLPAHGQAPVANAATVTPRKPGAVDDQPPAYSSPISNAATPAPVGATSIPSGPVTKTESRPEGARSVGDAVDSAGNPASSSLDSAKNGMATAAGAASGAAAATAATIKSVVPTSSEELKQQLEAANAQILRLKEQVQDQAGLRQRRAGSGADEKSTSSPVTTMQQQAPSGVPVPVVAALCLISFLLAYLLF